MIHDEVSEHVSPKTPSPQHTVFHQSTLPHQVASISASYTGINKIGPFLSFFVWFLVLVSTPMVVCRRPCGTCDQTQASSTLNYLLVPFLAPVEPSTHEGIQVFRWLTLMMPLRKEKDRRLTRQLVPKESKGELYPGKPLQLVWKTKGEKRWLSIP